MRFIDRQNADCFADLLQQLCLQDKLPGVEAEGERGFTPNEVSRYDSFLNNFLVPIAGTYSDQSLFFLKKRRLCIYSVPYSYSLQKVISNMIKTKRRKDNDEVEETTGVHLPTSPNFYVNQL